MTTVEPKIEPREGAKAPRRSQTYAAPPAFVQAATVAPSVCPPRPMGRKGARPVRVVRHLKWRSPEAFAFAGASFCVSLACLYVSAYARVASDTLQQNKLIDQMRTADREKEALQAEISRLTLPATVKQRAEALDMVPATQQTTRLLSGVSSASPPETEGR